MERERGITVKAQTASLFYTYNDKTYLLNLIGHSGKSHVYWWCRNRWREKRGITVKAQTASLFYTYNDKTYLLNLIDTPVSHMCTGDTLQVERERGITVKAQTASLF